MYLDGFDENPLAYDLIFVRLKLDGVNKNGSESNRFIDDFNLK